MSSSSIVFCELLETPKAYGDARVRIARARSEGLAGDLWVRFPARFAGEHAPHGEGDDVLVAFAYDDPTAAYALATFAPNPAPSSVGNYEVHARGGKDLRFIAGAGAAFLALTGGKIARLEGADGVRIVSGDDTVDVTKTGALGAEPVALYERTGVEIQALDGAVDAIVSALTAVYPALAAAVTAAKLVPFTASGILPPVIVGSQAAINLRAEPNPV